MRLITLSSCRREIRYLMAQKFPWQVPCAEENLGLGIEHTANSQSAALIKQTIKQGLKEHGSCSNKHLEIAFRGTNFKQLRSVECQTTTRKKKKSSTSFSQYVNTQNNKNNKYDISTNLPYMQLLHGHAAIYFNFPINTTFDCERPF